MLRIINRMGQLNFRQLMDVYEEGNRENASQLFPKEPEEQGILLAEQSFYQYLRECFFVVPEAFYAVWELNGRYVSALRMEPYQDGFLLEALETLPTERRKDYASELIKAVLEHMGQAKIYSHVSKKNMASLRTHEKCGFHRTLEHAVYADGSVLSNSCTFCSQK